VARKKIRAFKKCLRKIRQSLRPGTSIRSFGRLLARTPDEQDAREEQWLSWESKGHAPGVPALADALLGLRDLDPVRARQLAEWAHVETRDEDEDPILPSIEGASGGAIVPNVSAPSLPSQSPMRAAQVFPSTVGAALVDLRRGALGPQTTWKVLRALRQAPKAMPSHVEVLLAEVKSGSASTEAAERILDQLLPRLDSNKKFDDRQA